MPEKSIWQLPLSLMGVSWVQRPFRNKTATSEKF